MYNYSCFITSRIWRGTDVSTAVYAASRFFPERERRDETVGHVLACKGFYRYSR